MRVLFVESDDDPTPVSAERFADRDGLAVERATGVEAADGDADAFDCVVTNYALADGDGVKVVRAVDAAAPRLPAVLYTAVGDERVARDALRAGAADYVVAGEAGDRTDDESGEPGRDANAGRHEDREAAALERRVRAAVAGVDRTAGDTPTDRAAELEALDRLFRHDIRNDMAVIVGWADVLRDHVSEEGEEILDRILDNGRHTLELTDVAGDAAATVTDDGATAVEPTDLGEALREAVRSRREAFPGATIELGAVPTCRVAANYLLGSVFRSLLNDAVSNYDGDAPALRVSAERDGDTVRVRVADADPNGAGVRAEPAFGTGTDLERSDAGIDRYLVERLVDVYDGQVKVEDGAFVVELRASD